MSHELILTNLRAVLDDEVVDASIVVRDGRIAGIDSGRARLPAALDLDGDYLLPGLVELHTDNLERHLAPRPKVKWPMLPALLAHDVEMCAAGITTVFDALRIGSTVGEEGRSYVLRDALNGLHGAAANDVLRAEHLIHLRCEVCNDDVLDSFESLAEEALVQLVSVMDHTPGQRQFRDIAVWRSYYASRHKASDEQLDAHIAEKQARHGHHADNNRRAIAERCGERNLVVASHDDTTVAHIEEAHGLGLSIAEFPTTIEAAEAAHAHGMTTIAGAPNLVRGGSHSGNVSAAELAARGLLDALSSDYVPSSLLQGAFSLHHELEIPLPKAVATVSRNPARMLGLDDRGNIAVRQRADLAQVKISETVPVARQVWREGRRVV